MAMPTKLVDLSGSVRNASTFRIDLADLRDRNGQRIDWQPGDLLILNFHRPDVIAPPGWYEGHSYGRTAVAAWLTAGMVSAKFTVSDAGPTEWDGYVLRGVEPAELIDGTT